MLPQPEVVAKLKSFVTVKLYIDNVPIRSITPEQREKLAENNQDRLVKLTKTATVPSFVVLSPKGDFRGHIEGYHEPADLVAFLSESSNVKR